MAGPLAAWQTRPAGPRAHRRLETILRQQHALDAPFTTPDTWNPIPGACSRCGAQAWLGERRWWHDGPTCRARQTDRVTAPVPAEFIPSNPD